MNIVNYTYKFRIYPNKEQTTLLNKHLGCARMVYNHFLAEHIQQYKDTGKSDSYNKQSKSLTALKKEEDYKWLNEVNSQSIQFALKCLENAYENFFAKRAKFPRYKAKRSKGKFTVPQSGKIQENKLFLPKFKQLIRVEIDREIKGKIGKMSVTKNPNGHFYVSIFTEKVIKFLPKTGKQIGIDLGIKNFAITSDGELYENYRYTLKYAKKLRTAQKHLSRKKKGSNEYEKQRLKVARIHEKIANSRLDNLHKVSMKLVQEYDLIAIEDLHVKGMVRNKKLAKHISDVSWGTFITLLKYKCDWYGKDLVTIGRYYPSSKTCNKCKEINKNLKLSDRMWTCEFCKTLLDRDINAAINILEEGLKIFSAGTVEYTDGDSSKTRSEHVQGKHGSVKSETQLIGSAVCG